jgi:oxygen-independent coproporphyrinogen III oxidase
MSQLLPAVHPILAGSPYQSYVYAYPHKSAYRPLDPPRRLRDVWRSEDVSKLSLYVHVPFCTMRCGFCNLFTTARPDSALPEMFLEALEREADAIHAAIPEAHFTRFALGGGTPSYLTVTQLARIFRLVKNKFSVTPVSLPTGIEVSPDTVTIEKAQYLKTLGIERVSIGIQSFIEAEARDSGRPQRRAEIDAAFRILNDCQFPVLNIDLIYGLPGQTVESWLYSVGEALQQNPAEVYLYPLYVRPLTGLGRSRKSWDDVRIACYRAARERLLEAGFEQVTMRMFRRHSTGDGPAYCVQDEGMIGLGCGARSYTRSCHYSQDYAVSPKSVKAILQDYVTRDSSEFQFAHNGFELSSGEERRRYLLYSLFTSAGLPRQAYQARFGTDVTDDFAELLDFAERGWFSITPEAIRPTPQGLELSDALGPWFFSEAVKTLMAEYDLR